MIITVAFDVNNYVEVMEGWPLKHDNMPFFLEREGNILKRVCLSFSGVGIEHAPSFTQPHEAGGSANLNVNIGGYAALARKRIMNWQAVISGIQIVDLDYDRFDFQFHAENIEEESRIHLKSNYDKTLNSACDFEQIGRAFCANSIPDDRIESTSHYREGRLAFEAGRYVDAYNNMFLFLETRYCDGKTKTAQQIELLSKNPALCLNIEEAATELMKSNQAKNNEKFDLFDSCTGITDKIKALVLLRGKLRHHSLKSPYRWDPNQQDKHKGDARFLIAVVHAIVIKESLEDIYAPASLDNFRKQSVSSGNEIKIKLTTHRAKNERALQLDMSYPTTVVSSLLCVNTVRHAIEACEKDGQLADTVKFEAVHSGRGLELFSIDFDVWAYTETREIETKQPIEFIRCSFEHFRSDLIRRDELSIPYQGSRLTVLDVWTLLQRSYDHIEHRDPTTRIMSLKIFINDGKKAIVSYRLGALARF
ncbi:hypothetical protein [Limimaricola hongkongensis]|uniref:hypothetical protein n=1 Tax=Limimaricola hongkongensis TaxID=278132 RepID=UPI000A6BA8A0|nr:hypothetical protein [Limimaricola hongkongensis]